MKYEASTVYAFTPLNGNEKAHGNPALVVFGKLTDEERKIIAQQSRVELNGDLIELPIIDFIEPVDVENNIFNIRYYFFTGMEVSICGHGTICAVKAITEKYKKEKKKQIFTFNLNKNFEENSSQPQLKIESDGTYFRVEFDDVKIEPLDNSDLVYDFLLEHIPGIVKETIYYGELKDYMCISNDAKIIRETVIPLNELKKIRKLNPTYRGIFVVAKSDREGYDYETSVISDGLPAPVYKDPACGSANKEVPQFIRAVNLFPNRFKSGDVENFKMYYPYRCAEIGIIGGVQDVEYRWKDGKIFVVSGAKFGKNLELTVENGKLYF